ncbi:MAG: hypothetical protein LBB39_00550 [Mycoplasmataceae bacterium]|jgi:chromosome segregation ATPase|nr:hypothetical protein [Mycoplasmataceae bacterium]
MANNNSIINDIRNLIGKEVEVTIIDKKGNKMKFRVDDIKEALGLPEADQVKFLIEQIAVMGKQMCEISNEQKEDKALIKTLLAKQVENDQKTNEKLDAIQKQHEKENEEARKQREEDRKENKTFQKEIIAEFKEVKEDIKEIKVKQDKMEGDIKEIKVKQDKMEAKVDKMEGDIKEIKVKQDKMEAKVNKMEGDIKEIKVKQDKMEKDINNIVEKNNLKR